MNYHLVVNDEGRQRLVHRHPWLFKRHFSAKRLQAVHPGFPVSVVDAQGQFLAYGVADNQDELVFRAWSFKEEEKDFFSLDFLCRRLNQAWINRAFLGVEGSRRVLYSEADELSGVILDVYELVDPEAEVWFFQIATKAWDYLVTDPAALVRKTVETLVQSGGWPQEYLLKPRAWVIKKNKDEAVSYGFVCHQTFDLQQALVDIVLPGQGSRDSKKLYLRTNFLRAQKTGLFLDQREHLAAAAHWVKQLWNLRKCHDFVQNPFHCIKVLDLCCYRGAWSCAITQALWEQTEVEVHLVDQSPEALAHAQQNALYQGAKQVYSYLGDVFQVLDDLPNAAFDVVVCDPPAFAKSKQHLSSALRGYQVLNEKACAKLAKGLSLFITASCSRAVSRESFQKMVTEVLQGQKTPRQLVYTGTQAVDHRIMAHFPEGEYLKIFMYADWSSFVPKGG